MGTGEEAPAAAETVRGAEDDVVRDQSAAQTISAIYARNPELAKLLGERQLRNAARDGRIPADFVPYGRRRAALFNDVELEAWLLTHCRCTYTSPDGRRCERVGLGESGCCSWHGHTKIGNGAVNVPRPITTKRKISKTKQEKPHQYTLKERGEMAAKKRKYPAKRRNCKFCGKRILPERKGLEVEDIPIGLLEEHELDLVPGSVAQDFCSTSHHVLWAWVYDRRRFPQGTEEGAADWAAAMTALWWAKPSEAALKFREAWRNGTPTKQPLTSPSARKKWLPRWTLQEARDPSAKGRKRALEVGIPAMELVRHHPVLVTSRTGRRAAHEALMVRFLCGPEVIARGTDDRDYRVARQTMRRLLRRAYRELGEPAELADLI